MRCRRFVTENSKRTMVYFGSYGLDFSSIDVSIVLNMPSFLYGKYDDEIAIDKVMTTSDYITWTCEDFEMELRNYHQEPIDCIVNMSMTKQSDGSYVIALMFSYSQEHEIVALSINNWDMKSAFNGSANSMTPSSDDFTNHVKILGKAKRPNVDNDNPNYAVKQEGVSMSLMQRLTIIRGELKHFMNVGFPLFDKHPTKSMLDAYVVRTILNHPDVRNLVSFVSSVDNRTYVCKVEINTVYGNLTIQNSQSI